MAQLSATIDVSFVPENMGERNESGWEADVIVHRSDRIDGQHVDHTCIDEHMGYEAGDPGVLLARVAADLRTIREREGI